MSTLRSDRGSTQEVEREKLYLETTKKQNKLLDLEIEMKKVLLEIQKVELRRLNENQNTR